MHVWHGSNHPSHIYGTLPSSSSCIGQQRRGCWEVFSGWLCTSSQRSLTPPQWRQKEIEAKTDTPRDAAGRPRKRHTTLDKRLLAESEPVFFSEGPCQLFSHPKAALLSPACVANYLHSHLFWCWQGILAHFSPRRPLLLHMCFSLLSSLPSRLRECFLLSLPLLAAFSLWEDSQGWSSPLHAMRSLFSSNPALNEMFSALSMELFQVMWALLLPEMLQTQAQHVVFSFPVHCNTPVCHYPCYAFWFALNQVIIMFNYACVDAEHWHASWEGARCHDRCLGTQGDTQHGEDIQ